MLDIVSSCGWEPVPIHRIRMNTRKFLKICDYTYYVLFKNPWVHKGRKSSYFAYSGVVSDGHTTVGEKLCDLKTFSIMTHSYRIKIYIYCTGHESNESYLCCKGEKK